MKITGRFLGGADPIFTQRFSKSYETLVKVGQFVRAENLMKIGDKLTTIMNRGKFDAEFLGMLCDMESEKIQKIMLNETSIGIREISLLAAAVNVDEYELVTQSDSLCVGSGFIGKIVGIVRCEGQEPKIGILVNVCSYVARPYW